VVEKIKKWFPYQPSKFKLFSSTIFGYLIWHAITLFGVVLPEKSLHNSSLFLIDICLGYTFYFLYISIHAGGLFYSLIAVLAAFKQRFFCLILFLSHYAYGIWKFYAKDYKVNGGEIFSEDAIIYFIHPKSFLLFILPFLLFNILILVLLFWPQKKTELAASPVTPTTPGGNA
jgi:hypothetical protein